MRQAKKIFTRMLLNNWGGIDHQMIHFHEYVNLFSGKSGSGKSTVMDAMQVVLYGSVGSDFLNKAADDTKNKRSILSYLRGEQKDGSANRENQDFYSHLVLEIKDTATDSYTCIGVVFEVGRSDLDLKKYSFFSHAGKFSEDEYLTEERIPYSSARIRKLLNDRSSQGEKVGRVNVNRIYPSREAYINTVNDVIYGYVDAQRFKTMEKSAIALKMANGTGQFIKDYMFPKSEENTISAISEQLAAYREIKEHVEILENQIELLDEIQTHDKALTNARIDRVRTKSFLRILEIEDKRVQLEVREEDFAKLQKEIEELDVSAEAIKHVLKGKRDDLAKVQAELLATDFEKKRERLKQLEETIHMYENEQTDWKELVERLQKWNDTEGISDYISNPIYNCLDNFGKDEITEEVVEKIKRGLKETFDNIIEELEELKEECRAFEREYQEKKEVLDDLKSDKKHYSREVKEVRRILQEKLSDRYGRTIHVNVLADLFDITDEDWRNAIEGRLGRIKFGLVVEPQFALDAAKIFREMKKREYESVDLINTAAIKRDEPKAQENTLYDAVETEIPYVDFCLKRFLGHIRKCDSVEELNEVKDGVTKDCYSYSNYMFRHLREKDYRYQTIGKKISQKQIRELEETVCGLSEKLITKRQEIATLNQVNDFEKLNNYSFEKLFRLSTASVNLKKFNKKADVLRQEIEKLEQGIYVAELREQENTLQTEITGLEEKAEYIQKKRISQAKDIGKRETDIRERRQNLEELQEGFVPNKEMKEEVLAQIGAGKASALRREKLEEAERLGHIEEQEEQARGNARMHFIKAFPSYDFSGIERDNTVYDDLLDQCRNNFEPSYMEEFDKQYQLVYRMLRENVIATIHSEIKGAKRHRREINAMLSRISFSDSIYQIDILPTDDENRQFYEMLTAEELDMKVLAKDVDGQISFGEDEFYQKYEAQIKRLTDKFMPPKDSDQTTRDKYRREMEKYADYRTYLKFSMYEQAKDVDGNIKKNYVDDMAGRDSGGEGQNPKYVALLAGFAMLYMQQSDRDSKIRLVMLDEAFSKMDKERSEVCLHYARQLGLQLVVCVPDERLQSLIQNVDCVYAFRRANNHISMIHIDKGQYLKMLEGDEEEEASFLS